MKVMLQLGAVGTLEIIVNAAIVSQPVPSRWPRMHPEECNSIRRREDYIHFPFESSGSCHQLKRVRKPNRGM